MELFEHQTKAVEVMFGESSYILADEMGLGKTVIQLSEIKHWQEATEEAYPMILVACPNSVKSVWADHSRLLLPDLPVVIIDSKTRAKDLATYEYGLLIVNWDAIRLMPELAKRHWDFVIADEAHNIKNRKALKTKALKKIKKVTYRRALTGTPLINRPDELWSILNWLYPKEFRSYWNFYEGYIYYIEHPQFKYKIFIKPKNVESLQESLRPFTLIRTKREVLKDFPEKYYQTIRLEMTRAQQKSYAEMKKDSLTWLASFDSDEPLMAPTVLAKLTRLRQFSSAHATLDEEGKVLLSEPSNKLDALMDILESTDKQIVVFSQFKQLIYLATNRLDKAGIEFVSLTGDTPSSTRGEYIADFQNGKVRVFLATIQAGGVGVTLTAADTCVFLDRSWSPAHNMQAEDRLHRIGQKNAVQIINLVSSHTVDEAIEDKLEFKRQMIEEIIGGL